MIDTYEIDEWWNSPGFEDEEWRNIFDFPDYDISNFGRVWSWKSHKFLKPYIDHDGYERIDLYYKGKATHMKVHRLVAQAFLVDRSGADQINHDDGDKTYNCIENLAWVTRSENSLHAFRTGLNVRNNKRAVFCIETNELFESLTSCADWFNTSPGTIHNCLSGRNKTCHGLHFEYVDPILEPY